MTLSLTRDQYCALLMGAGYAVGAMTARDASAVQSTIDWLAEATDALRAAMMAQGMDEPTDVKGPAL